KEMFQQWVEGGEQEKGDAASADAVPAQSQIKAVCQKPGLPQQPSGSGSAAGGGDRGGSASGSGSASGPGSDGSGSDDGSGSGSASGSGSGAASGSGSSARPATYTQDIKPLIDANCMTCHAAGKQAPDLSTFAAAQAAGAKAVMRVVAGTM